MARRTWLFTVITVVSCAAFAARAATSIAEAAMARDSDGIAPRVAVGVAPPTSPASAKRRATGPLGDLLVERNIFCSSCGPATASEFAPSVNLASAVLIETSLGGEPRATVRVVASDVQGSWGVGETIPGLGRIAHIAFTWIDLVDPAGHHGRLSLLEAPQAAASRGSDTAMSESPAAAAPPWSRRIRKLDEQNYDVDRDLIRELVTGVAKADGVRPVVILEHGEIKGLRLTGVTAASIPFALGLRSGDALTAIDGAPIKTAQQLLDLYAKIDQLSAVELSGTRAGKPLLRTLRLR